MSGGRVKPWEQWCDDCDAGERLGHGDLCGACDRSKPQFEIVVERIGGIWSGAVWGPESNGGYRGRIGPPRKQRFGITRRHAYRRCATARRHELQLAATPQENNQEGEG